MRLDWEWMIETLGMMASELRENFVKEESARKLPAEHKAALPHLRAAMGDIGEARERMRLACQRVDEVRAKQLREWADAQSDKESMF